MVSRRVGRSMVVSSAAVRRGRDLSEGGASDTSLKGGLEVAFHGTSAVVSGRETTGSRAGWREQ